MSFTNRDLLRRRMKSIPVAVRKAVRAQLRANAIEFRDTAKSFVPVDTGQLKENIFAIDVSDSTQMSWRVSAGSFYAHYARWVEFGTAASAAQPARQNRNYRRTAVLTRSLAAHHATEARPFFWPAYRLKKRAFKARVTRAAKKAIKDAIR